MMLCGITILCHITILYRIIIRYSMMYKDGTQSRLMVDLLICQWYCRRTYLHVFQLNVLQLFQLYAPQLHSFRCPTHSRSTCTLTLRTSTYRAALSCQTASVYCILVIELLLEHLVS